MSISNASSGNDRVHVFDMDGTLLRSTATIVLARHLGHAEAGESIERRWGEGDISDTEFWTTLLEICQNATSDDIDAAFHNAPWMNGIAEVFADIQSRGETVIVISQSPTFFVDRLQSWGAHETYGSSVKPGTPLSDTATLMPEAKVAITNAVLEKRQLSAADCVVFGDSSSDIELFKTFGHSIGVNASPLLQGLAAQHYVGTDMRQAYAMGRELLNAATERQVTQGSDS